MMSSVRISAMGTRNGPKTFGSWKNAWTRPPSTKRSLPGMPTKNARTPSVAEPTAANA